MADLVNQAKGKGYLTEEEGNNLGSVDEIKLRQVLARSTNEILAGITLPLRRLKKDADDEFNAKYEALEDEEAKKEALEKRKEDKQLPEL